MIGNASENYTVQEGNEILKQLNDELAIRYLPVMIYMGLLIFTGFFGNILVVVIYARKKTKTSTAYFIINLAILDMLTVVIGMPTEIADLRYPYMFYAPVACKLLRAVESLSTMGSIVTLMAVAIDRHNRICKHGKQMTSTNAKKVCYLAIFIGVITCWPAAVVFGKKTKDIGIQGVKAVDCSTDDSMKGTKYPLLYYGSLFLYFVVCVIFFSVVYTKIVLYIKRQKKKGILSNQPKSSTNVDTRSSTNETSFTDVEKASDGSAKEQTSRKSIVAKNESKKTKRNIPTSKITLMLGIVTVVFVFSFLPFLTVMVVRNIVKNFEELLSPAAEVLYKFCLKSYFINNSINPVIYSFMNPQFREDVRIFFKTISSRCRRKHF